MAYASKQRMRKAAILVANLDGPCARRLLDGLSPADADALRQAVAELGSIDPEESSDVLQEFCHSTAVSASASDAVEVAWSVPTRETASASHETIQPIRESSTTNEAVPYSFLRDTDTQTMADLLSVEHPQTVAIVMSQLSADLAADLLSYLSGPLQADVLERLAELHPAEPETVQIVESHLANWFESHRQRESRKSQGQEKIQQILAKTSGKNREKILAQLGRRNGSLASRIGSVNDEIQPASATSGQSEGKRSRSQQEIDLAAAVAQVQCGNETLEHRLERSTMDHSTRCLSTESQSVEDPLTRSQPSKKNNSSRQQDFQLSDLDVVGDRVLLESLRRAEPQVAMLALAGADQRLIDRIAGQLPRRQAKQFRRQLHRMEPTRVGDLLAAQYEFVQLAGKIAAEESSFSATTRSAI